MSKVKSEEYSHEDPEEFILYYLYEDPQDSSLRILDISMQLQSWGPSWVCLNSYLLVSCFIFLQNTECWLNRLKFWKDFPQYPHMLYLLCLRGEASRTEGIFFTHIFHNALVGDKQFADGDGSENMNI